MRKIAKGGFTLIELLIAMTIMVLMLTMSYAPYNTYKDKSKVRLASKEVAQSFYEAKNMATSGVAIKDGSEFSNKSIGVYINTTDTKNGKVTFYAFPHDTDPTSTLTLPPSSLREKKIQDKVEIFDISTGSPSSSLSNKEFLFFYTAIKGELTVLSGTTGAWTEVSGNQKIWFRFGKSTSSVMQKGIELHTATNVVDYNLKP